MCPEDFFDGDTQPIDTGSNIEPTEQILPVEITDSEVLEIPEAVIAGATIKKSPERGKENLENEDVLLINGTTGLVVIADGMGGLRQGKKAAKTFAEYIDNFVTINRKTAPILDTFLPTFVPQLEEEYSDTTGTAIKLESNTTELDIVHIGDTRLYAIRKTHNNSYSLVQLTADMNLAFSNHPLFEPITTYLLGLGSEISDKEKEKLYVQKTNAIRTAVKNYSDGTINLDSLIQVIRPPEEGNVLRWLDYNVVDEYARNKPLPEYTFVFQDCAEDQTSYGFFGHPEKLQKSTYTLESNDVGFLLLTDGITNVLSSGLLQSIVETVLQQHISQEQASAEIVKQITAIAENPQEHSKPEEILTVRNEIKNDDRTAGCLLLSK